jgi:outer membrane receptor protein involved in Fe transport
MLRKSTLLALIVFVMGISLYAQTTGSLAGVVRDNRGNAIHGAVIQIQGTEIGANSDERGRYTIINLTPGTYNVSFRATGYARVVVENVRIRVGDTTPLNAVMQIEAIAMDEYIIQAQEQLINFTRTGTENRLSADDIGNVIARDLTDIIVTTPGVVRAPDGSFNVRGGRAGETVISIDGMSVSDPVDGGRALTVDPDAISDMKVMTGGFTAEFGNAQSGIVNIVTKDGTENWEGKLEAITDHLFTTGSNYDEIKFALGGPVPIYLFAPDLRSRFTFFLNGAAAWDDTRFRKHYVSDPWNEFRIDGINLMNVAYTPYDPYADRDKVLGFEIGNRNNNNYNLNLKTSYVISNTQKLTFAVRGDRNYNTPFRHSWRYSLQHYAESDTRQRQYIVTYDHVIDPRRTLQVKGSYYWKTEDSSPRGVTRENYLFPLEGWTRQHGIDGIPAFSSIAPFGTMIGPGYRDAMDWIYNIHGFSDPRRVPGFVAPGTVWDNFVEDKSKQYNFRTDFEYQISQVVGMKTGFEFIQHDIVKNQLQSFLMIYMDRYRNYLREFCTPDTTITNPITGAVTEIYLQEDYFAAAKAASGRRDGYQAKPIQLAYYAQTKIDWEGMIVNAGLRMDMWYLGKSYDLLQDDGSFKKREFRSQDRTQVMLSPRLGVSHPISERDVIHFAYNYQNQLPPMRYVFTSKDSLDANQSPGVTVGNPALEPQITITYEVGLQHLLTDDYVLGITAYYKNFYNYVSTRKIESHSEAALYWYEYISEDYGSARGVDFTINRRMFNFLAGGASYSLAWAQGNNSETVVQDETTSLREFPLDWDIRHFFSINGIFLVRRGEEFMVPFTNYFLPFDDFSISMNYYLASGRPYTPMTMEGNVRLETNSKRMPYTQNADIRFSKNFKTSEKTSIRATFTIENLFKMKVVNQVYPRTGSPYRDGADISETNYPGVVFPETAFLYNNFIRNPGFINNDRNYIFGISFNF